MIKAIVALCLVVTAALSLAEGSWGKSNILALMREDVRADLRLSPEQKTKIEAGFEGYVRRGKAGEVVLLRGWPVDKAIAIEQVLTESQRTRFVQILVQMRGGLILVEPRVQAALALSQSQVEHIEELEQAFRSAVSGKAVLAAGNGGRLMLDEKMLSAQREKLLSVLTAPQRASLKRLAGDKPFKPK